MFLDGLAPWFVIASAVCLGLAFGSFLNVVIYRLPREQSLSHPPSQCPACGRRIAFYDNVPVLGWLLLRGRARCCKQKISARYPLIELLGGLVAWSIVEVKLLPNHDLQLGDAALLFALYLALALGMIAAAAIDLEHMILPDSITLGGAVIGVLSSFVRPEVTPWQSLVGAAGGFLIIWLPFIWGYQKLRGFPGMGLGDAKILMLAGAWFGVFGAVFCLFAGALQGTIATVIVLLTKGRIEEPEAVTRERAELVAEIERAEGEEKAELERILREDPLGLSPEDAAGGPRIAFGPFLALSIIELLLFFQPVRIWAEIFFLGAG